MRLLVAAVVVGVTFAVPAAALAGNGAKCNASACKVYIEQSLPNGTGGGGSTSTTPLPVSKLPVSKKAARALAHAGKDKAALTRLVQNPELFLRTREPSNGYSDVAAPTALSAAFDVGTGPTALFATLAGMAVLLLLSTAGLSAWRRRRRAST